VLSSGIHRFCLLAPILAAGAASSSPHGCSAEYVEKTPFSQAGRTYGSKLKISLGDSPTKADQSGNIRPQDCALFCHPEMHWAFPEKRPID